jgi:hypothetical protein
VYYGATTKRLLSERWAVHSYSYRNGTISCSSVKLFDKYGLENCSILLVELVPCNSKDELSAREGWYIRNNPCVNHQIPTNKQRIECYCGSTYYDKDKRSHIKTLKHTSYSQSVNE